MKFLLQLKHFSQAPPPVDRPTPVKVLLPPGPPATLSTPTGAASKLPLSPQGPKGPPPKPPPRPVRGHARSASLDLN
uniref:Uncharacterized protein n=1 Tax=Plectus sambesii TaxID=2011161 RepID=A0A914VAY8_9BILA